MYTDTQHNRELLTWNKKREKLNCFDQKYELNENIAINNEKGISSYYVNDAFKDRDINVTSL